MRRLVVAKGIRLMAVAGGCLITAAIGQVGVQNETVAITDPRPLARAVEVLERRFGVAVSYEDAAYAYSGDLVDKTDAQYKQAHPDATVLIPKGGSLAVTLPQRVSILGGSASLNIAPTIQAIIDQHNMNGFPGQFRLVKTVTGYSIVPTAVRGVSGVVVADQSPLDTVIRFPSMQRDAMQAVNLICQSVTDLSGKKVLLGIVPHDLRDQVSVLGASQEPARDVLARLFGGRSWADSRNIAHIKKLSWSLLYGPDVQYYALNVHVVTAEVRMPTGMVALKPVDQ